MRLQSKNTSNKSKALVGKILNKIETAGTRLSLPRKNFIKMTMLLFLSMRGRYTFKGMGRYGERCEKTCRLQFEKPFDFLTFNMALCENELSKELILAFDPSYLPKSGKKTPHRGNFWSGCQGRSIKGLEIGGLGVVDLTHNTAFNLEAIQSPDPKKLKEEGLTLIDHYAQIIIDRHKKLMQLSKYLVVDGFFAKKKFVDSIIENTSLQLVCKLRQDANLKYYYKGPKRKGRGRPKKFDGKVDLKNIDKRRFKKIHQDNDVIIYEAELWWVSCKRKIKVAYVEFLDDGKPTNRYQVYFSTDLDLCGSEIFRFYKSRFQIEFLFRDAKQFTGLTHCQARSENKIYFHTNMSLTSVGIAKIAHYINDENCEKDTFSISDIKTSYFNERMLNLFLSNFEIDLNLKKNKDAINRILEFGKIAA